MQPERMPTRINMIAVEEKRHNKNEVFAPDYTTAKKQSTNREGKNYEAHPII
jgi:hypothetical protein